jgi:short-subunit dehydrogenase
MKKENTIIITGASSGIGQALCLQYSIEGNNLCIIGRSEKSLIEVKERSISYGAKNVDIIIADVNDANSMNSIINNIAEKYNIQIVFCAAAIASNTADPEKNVEEQIINTNILGTLNTINPIIPIMKNQRYGQIALFSSLIKYIPLPKSASYIASKAAIINYGECLNILLDQYNISVSIIMPGLVTSKMSKLSNYKDFTMMPAEKAASIIMEGIKARKTYIIFPKLSYFFVKIFSILPFFIKKYLITFFVRD